MADWDHFLNKKSILPDEYYGSGRIEKLRAFSFAQAASLDQVRFVQQQLGAVLRDGGTFRDFKKLVQSGGLSVNLPDYRLQNIFRTNVMSAYGRGRYMEQAQLSDSYGYYKYHTAEDPKVRPNHAALNGLVIKFGTPEGDMVYPPNGYQCRCWTQLLNDEAARAQRTVSEEATNFIIKNNPPDKGFEGSPLHGINVGDPEILKHLTDYDVYAVPDAAFRSILEDAVNYPNGAGNTDILGKVISETMYRKALAEAHSFQEVLAAKAEAEARAKAALGENKGVAPEDKKKEKPSLSPLKDIFTESQLAKLEKLNLTQAEIERLVKEAEADNKPIDPSQYIKNHRMRNIYDAENEQRINFMEPVWNNKDAIEKDYMAKEAIKRLREVINLRGNSIGELNDDVFKLITTDLDLQAKLVSEPLDIKKLMNKETYKKLDLSLKYADDYRRASRPVDNWDREYYKNFIEPRGISGLAVQNLPDGLKQALSSYTFDGKDRLINETMRETINSEAAKKLIRIIDTAIELGTENSTEKITVFRGITHTGSIKDKLKGLPMNQLKPGMIMENRSLLSFSESKSVAEDYADGPEGIIWVLKSDKGLPIVSISKYHVETERLFKSSSKFKILKKYQKDGKTYFDIELLSDKAKADYIFTA